MEPNGIDWAGLIMSSNEAALQWAEFFTGRQRDPGLSIQTGGGGSVQVSQTSGIVLLVGLALVVFLIVRD